MRMCHQGTSTENGRQGAAMLSIQLTISPDHETNDYHCNDHGAARQREKTVQYFHACSLLLLSRTREGHRRIELIEDRRCGSSRRGRGIACRCNRGQRRRICRLRRDSRGGLGVCCRCRTGRGRRLFRAGSAKAQKDRQNQQNFHSAPPEVSSQVHLARQWPIDWPQCRSDRSIAVLELRKPLQGFLGGAGEHHLLVAHLERTVGHHDILGAHAQEATD